MNKTRARSAKIIIKDGESCELFDYDSNELKFTRHQYENHIGFMQAPEINEVWQLTGEVTLKTTNRKKAFITQMDLRFDPTCPKWATSISFRNPSIDWKSEASQAAFADETVEEMILLIARRLAEAHVPSIFHGMYDDDDQISAIAKDWATKR